MIYLKNDNTLFQEIWIPRQEFDYTSVSPYEKGYEDGMAAQKAKLVSTAITENGTVEKADGFSSVTVDVQEQGITKEMDLTGDTLTIGRTTRPTVWDKTVYGGNLTDFEALIDQYGQIGIDEWINEDHTDRITKGWFTKENDEYEWFDYQMETHHPFSSISQTWQNVGFAMLMDGSNVFFYDSTPYGIYVYTSGLTLDDLIFDVAQTHMMSAVTVDATTYGDVKYDHGYNAALGIVKRDAIDLTFTENGTWEADPDFFNHIFAKKVVVNVGSHKEFFTFVNRTASAGTVTFNYSSTYGVRTFVWKTSNDGVNWTTNTFWQTKTFALPAYGYLYIDGSECDYFPQLCRFSCDVEYDVRGDLSTLVKSGTETPTNAFGGLFEGDTNLVSAKELRLDYDSMNVEGGYRDMFGDCTSLIESPTILATTLGFNCCLSMFRNCKFQVAPDLPATTIGTLCYCRMFEGCKKLEYVPSILPARTLASYCYSHMFLNCSSLGVAPVLPAETLTTHAYNNMFSGAYPRKVVIYATDISATDCVTDMLRTNPASGATIYCPASMVSTWQQLYPNWTVQAV